MIALSLAGIALISLLAQWLAWSVRVPAILFLLLSGLLLGPMTGMLDPDALLGELLFPLVSLSMGIVDCAFEIPFSAEDFSQRVAEVKKFAKTKPGNSYVHDRRTPLGAKV